MSHKILLIDDDELILVSIQSLLETEDFTVEMASSGAEALQKAAADSFDVFVLDIIMPAMSGFEVCAALRAMDAYAETPIVMLTAKSAEPDRRKAMEMGATRLLPKPIDPDILLDVLREVLQER